MIKVSPVATFFQQQRLRRTQRQFQDLPAQERRRLREQFEAQRRRAQGQQQNPIDQGILNRDNQGVNRDRTSRVRPNNPTVRQDRVIPRVQRTIPQTRPPVRPDVRPTRP